MYMYVYLYMGIKIQQCRGFLCVTIFVVMDKTSKYSFSHNVFSYVCPHPVTGSLLVQGNLIN